MIKNNIVAPLAGAWIETSVNMLPFAAYYVAPLAGAWIETLQRFEEHRALYGSRPSRARGLKLVLYCAK